MILIHCDAYILSFLLFYRGFPFLTLQDKSSTSNLKIEALIFTRLVLASNSPSVFHPYIKVTRKQVTWLKYIVTCGKLYFLWVKSTILVLALGDLLTFLGLFSTSLLMIKCRSQNGILTFFSLPVSIVSFS